MGGPSWVNLANTPQPTHAEDARRDANKELSLSDFDAFEAAFTKSWESFCATNKLHVLNQEYKDFRTFFSEPYKYTEEARSPWRNGAPKPFSIETHFNFGTGISYTYHSILDILPRTLEKLEGKGKEFCTKARTRTNSTQSSRLAEDGVDDDYTVEDFTRIGQDHKRSMTAIDGLEQALAAGIEAIKSRQPQRSKSD